MSKKRDLTSIDDESRQATKSSSRSEIDAFLQRATTLGPVSPGARGRLVFALDATMSRQPTWDLACELQAEMFDAAGEAGKLAVQLVYFRGFGECQASKWANNTAMLRDMMVKIDCRGGHTQIRKVLAHIKRSAKSNPVAALVYVGDAMEENIDQLCQMAGEIGLMGVKAFMFHEGQDPIAGKAFREIARLTGGAYMPFNTAAADELRAMLGAVATYAAGGRPALESSPNKAAKLLASRIGR
ncbi:MAG: VWA domain-containing protein [Alphaproteobacteria bacterium]